MLFDHTSLNIVFPLLTLLFFDSESRFFAVTASHELRSFWYGLCVSLPHTVNLISAPLLCILSDRIGRRHILLFAASSAFAFALMGGISVLCGSLMLLFLACILRGLFSRTNPVAQAVIGDISPPGKKILYIGYLQTAISAGACLGPVMGGMLAKSLAFPALNFSLPFFVAALFALMGFCLTLRYFQETLPSAATEKKEKADGMSHWQAFLALFKNRHVFSISMVLLLSQCTWSLYYQFMPPLLKTFLHADARQLGQFVGLLALWLALASLFGLRLLNAFLKTGAMLLFSLWLLLAGLLLTLAVLVLPAFTAFPFLPWLTALPVAAGDVIAFSCLCTFYSDAVSRHGQGKIMGMSFVVISAAWSLSGMLGGVMTGWHPLLPLAVAVFPVLGAIVVAARLQGPQE